MNSDLFARVSRVSARKAAINADQVEADAIRLTYSPVASCLDDDAIAYDRLPEEYDTATNPAGNAEWAEESDARETAVGEATNEIERRIALLGDRYPFDLSADKLLLTHVPARAASGVYGFCLGLSVTSHDLTSKPACGAVREFERLVGQSLRTFLHGDQARCYRSGAPANGDRPTTISAMLQDLHTRTNGEWRFNPPSGSAAPADQGDDGIDVVVWKSFGDLDRRIGKPFLLAQCACGDEDYWIDKVADLNPDGFEKKWGGTISFGGLLRCLATPRHVPHESVWRDGTAKGGILLDRARLTWIGETALTSTEQVQFKSKLDPHTTLLSQQRKTRMGVKPGKRPGSKRPLGKS